MRFIPALLALALLVPSVFANEIVPPEKPRIDVVFCIDRSGSMGGVIETAKQKVWSIVNQIARAKPSPELRIGLIGYGSGERIVHKLDLTSDLDEVYKHLNTYKVDAGGDEFVGHAIQVATRDMKWAEGKQVLKIIYVVGNETAHQGPSELDYAKTAPAAIKQGIMVNAIYCGNEYQDIVPTWREVAKLADGQFLQIAGDGGAVVVATPFDKELAELNGKLNATYVRFGARGAAAAENQLAQDANAGRFSSAVLADRVAAKGSAQYSNAYWDLVDAAKQKDFDLKKVKDEELPEEVRKLDPAGRQAYIERKTKERDEINKSIKEAAAKRDAYVKEETAKLAKAGKGDSFDAAVRGSLRKQAEGKGFTFDEK
jgi:hypothetical protein